MAERRLFALRQDVVRAALAVLQRTLRERQNRGRG